MNPPAAEARLLEAVGRRLRDTRGRPVRVELRKIALEENVSRRQAIRALRALAEAEFVHVTEHGGVIVLASPQERAA
jgi:hypothetical protein